jgi:para-aminobenzoate synthetase component 1
MAGYEAIYRHDARTGQADLLAVSEAAAARLRRRLLLPAPPLPEIHIGPAGFETDRDEYCRRVRRVQEYLAAGDCYQVNLCHRLRARVEADQALPLYLRLRAVAPAPLGAYLRLDPQGGGPAPVLLSNSPELLLHADLESGQAQTRPIKGTRRRGGDAGGDRLLAEELLASEKDLAEHLMIVDLLRHDLGRVATVGSVAVDGFARLVSLPTVHHLVSTVRCDVRPGTDLAELLAALLPGGSITGAPKVRAMEIIDELEPVRRGPFYGALGFISATSVELALCIRTAVVRDGELTLSVGGGIVLDSTPEGEWNETRDKAAAFLRALC